MEKYEQIDIPQHIKFAIDLYNGKFEKVISVIENISNMDLPKYLSYLFWCDEHLKHTDKYRNFIFKMISENFNDQLLKIFLDFGINFKIYDIVLKVIEKINKFPEYKSIIDNRIILLSLCKFDINIATLLVPFGINPSFMAYEVNYWNNYEKINCISADAFEFMLAHYKFEDKILSEMLYDIVMSKYDQHLFVFRKFYPNFIEILNIKPKLLGLRQYEDISFEWVAHLLNNGFNNVDILSLYKVIDNITSFENEKVIFNHLFIIYAFRDSSISEIKKALTQHRFPNELSDMVTLFQSYS